jgi:hypothetical protein
VVPKSTVAQSSPIEEQQQQEDHDDNVEDRADEEYSPLSDTEAGKMY